jgi:hypothetical protein
MTWNSGSVAMSTQPVYCSQNTAALVKYELSMFDYLYKKLESLFPHCKMYDPGNVLLPGTGGASDDEMEVSSLLESFLLHSRVLLDFFYYQNTREKDDLRAGDFLDHWGTRSRSECQYLHVSYQRLNKSLAHLTLKRIEYATTGKEWDIHAIYAEIKKVAEEFTAYLPPERKSWFE